MSTDYLSTLGVGTGLNTKEIVDSLMEVERESRLSSITKKKDKLEAQISAYGELSEAFQSFKTITDDLKSQSSVGYSVSTTDTKVLEAKVTGSEAQLQSTSVTVTSLASRQILTKSGYASATSEVGMGSMNIKFGSWSGGSFSQNSNLQSISVSIGAANNSLNGVAQALNQAFRNAGIDANASVAKVSSTGSNDYMLMISSAEGASSGMEITVTEETGSSGLASFNYKSGATTMTQSQASSDAALTVNGVNFTRSTNAINDLLPGIELNLKTVSDTAQKLNVSNDAGALEDKIKEFIEGYNSLFTFLKTSTSINENGEKGDLFGDSLAKTFLRQLKSSISSPIKGYNSNSVYLANLGIETNRNGTLNLNKSKFDTVLNTDRGLFKAMFTSETKSASSEVKIVRTNSRDTLPGVYSLTNVTAPTSTKIVSTNATTDLSSSNLSLTGSGGDNQFSIVVDGVSSSVISVATGTYSSGTSLASAIETAINSDANLIAGKVGVEVSFNSSTNKYTITNNKLGSSGSLSIASISSELSTALSMSTSSTASQGQNAAGMIDGIAMTSFGSQLTSPSGASKGLTIELSSSASPTTISVGNSLSNKLSGLLEGFLTTSLSDNYTNSIPEKITDLDGEVVDVELETQAIEDRLTSLRERYVGQFTRMEQLSISLKSTQDMMSNLMKSLYSDN